MNKLTVAACTNDVVNIDSDQHSRWPATLTLGVAKTSRGSRLVKNSSQGPLYVQKPFYPEGSDVAHIYLLHPPGGMVSGDHLSISITLQEQTSALFTTPGAGRVYRARKDKTLQQQRILLNVAKNSCVEWFPLETIAYSGSYGKLTTRVELEENSQFFGWDITCLGLPACTELFKTGQFQQRFEVYRNGQLALIENLNITAENHTLLQSMAGLQGFSTSGVFIAGPIVENEDAESLIAQLREVQAPENEWLAVTCVGGFVVIRYLGECAQRARDLFVRCWALLREFISQRPACAPRIWMT